MDCKDFTKCHFEITVLGKMDNYTALHVAVQTDPCIVDCHRAQMCMFIGSAIGKTTLHVTASLITKDAIKCAGMLLKS
uniref:Uncharacterized protein n=1 Tax=Onchocerca volvulus TaxID=6282 RepID=A0A8R1XPF3_ONCVO